MGEVSIIGVSKRFTLRHAELLPWLTAYENVAFALEMKGLRGSVIRETAMRKIAEILEVNLPRPRKDGAGLRGMQDYADLRFRLWNTKTAPAVTLEDVPAEDVHTITTRRPLSQRVPRLVLTILSVVTALVLWEVFGSKVNPIFGSHPIAIAQAALELSASGAIWKALWESLQPFLLGYGAAIVVGAPLGLLLGRYRGFEALFGIYVTAGYAMPLVALVPLLTLWLGLGFAVKVAIIFLMAVFPVCINTWLGVRAVPQTLIDVGRALVAPDSVILRRIVLPATLPYIVAGMKLAIGRAVVAMIIADQ
eukprot:gene6600-6669_t